jgi:hypothetical protein
MPALHQDLVTTLLDYEILTPVVGFWSQLHLAVLKEVEDLLAQLLELPDALTSSMYTGMRRVVGDP